MSEVVANRDGLLLLRVEGSEPPVYLVKEWHFEADTSVTEYSIDEGMCPVNIVDCEAVLVDGDTDPHGIFEFVQLVRKPEDWPFVGIVDWERYRRLFSALPEPEAA